MKKITKFQKRQTQSKLFCRSNFHPFRSFRLFNEKKILNHWVGNKQIQNYSKHFYQQMILQGINKKPQHRKQNTSDEKRSFKNNNHFKEAVENFGSHCLPDKIFFTFFSYAQARFNKAILILAYLAAQCCYDFFKRNTFVPSVLPYESTRNSFFYYVVFETYLFTLNLPWSWHFDLSARSCWLRKFCLVILNIGTYLVACRPRAFVNKSIQLNNYG